jgi:DNA-binding NarL/FixJ family response regulator
MTNNGTLLQSSLNPVSKASIRVVVFDSTQMICDLLSHAMEGSQYGLKVVGKATNLAASERIPFGEADVAIISASLKDGMMSGFTLLRRLVKGNSAMRCVMLLDQDDDELVVEAFRSGAVGVCERNQSPEVLCKCVYSVHQGQVWANSQQLKRVVDALATGMPTRVTDVRGQLLLTNREDQIVSLVAEGLKNREIADLLKLSEHTVKNHLSRIFEKLGISTRTELILYLLGQKAKGIPKGSVSPLSEL